MPKTPGPDTKSTHDTAQKANTPAPAMPSVLAAESLASLAGPMVIQRAMADPGKLAPINIPGLQRTIGNQHVKLMLLPLAPPSAGAETKPGPQQNNKTTSVVQREPDGNGPVELSDTMTGKINRGVQQGGGQLPQNIQIKMKRNLGVSNPEDIQVHTDQNADTLSKSLGARAFTTGKHIFFREGEYNPGSSQGQALIYHEGVHTVQQGGVKRNGANGNGANGGNAAQTKTVVNPPGDKYEQEADEIAEDVVQAPERAEPRFTEPQATPRTSSIQRAEEDEEKSDEEKEEEEQRKQEAKEKGDEKEKESKEQSEKDKKEGKEKGKSEGKKKGEPEQPKPLPPVPKGGEFTPPPPKVDPSVVDDIDGDTATEMKFDPDSFEFEEPEETPLLPTWDELADGTVQLSMDEVEEEYRIRMGMAETDPADFTEIDDSGGIAVDEMPGQEQSPKSGADLVGEAFAQGALTGFTEGAKSWATDTLLEKATSNIKYADGLINLAKLAYDPKAWVEDNVFAVGNSFKDVGSAFADLGDENTVFGVIAGTLELVIKIIDAIQSVIGLIQQIFQILLFIFHIISKLSKFLIGLAPFTIVIVLVPVFPFAWTPAVFTPIGTFCDTAIAFLDPLNEVLSQVGNVLTGVKYQLQPFAILFRTLDMLTYQGDPEEMEKKQQKLQGNIQGFVQLTTTKALENAKNQAGESIQKRRDKREIADLEAKAQASDDPDLQARLAAKKEEFGENYRKKSIKDRAKELAVSSIGGAFGMKMGKGGKVEYGGVAGAIKGGLTGAVKGVKGAKELATSPEARAKFKEKVKAAPGKFAGKVKTAVGKVKAAPGAISATVKKVGSKEGRAELKESLKKTWAGKIFMERRQEVKRELGREEEQVEAKIKERAKKSGEKIKEQAKKQDVDMPTELEQRLKVQKVKEEALEKVEKAKKSIGAEDPEKAKHLKSQQQAEFDADRKRQKSQDASDAADAAEVQARDHQKKAMDAEAAKKQHEDDARNLNTLADEAQENAARHRQQADVEKANQEGFEKQADESRKRALDAEAQAGNKQKELENAQKQVEQANERLNRAPQEAEQQKREANQKVKDAQWQADVANERVAKLQSDISDLETKNAKHRQQGDTVDEIEAEAQLRSKKQLLADAQKEAEQANDNLHRAQGDAERQRIDADRKVKEAQDQAEQAKKRKADLQTELDEINKRHQQAQDEFLENNTKAEEAEKRKNKQAHQAELLEQAAKRNRRAAKKAQDDADEAERQRKKHEDDMNDLVGVAKNKREEAELYEQAAKESDLIARKEGYRAKPPEEEGDPGRLWKLYDKFKKATDPGVMGGQRHGFGITGTDFFGYIISKVTEYTQDYKEARAKTDEAITARDENRHQDAFDIIRALAASGMGANKWQDLVKDLKKIQYGGALSYLEKKKKIDDYQRLADDINSFYVYGSGNQPSMVGQRYKVILHGLGLPTTATRVDPDATTFTIKLIVADSDGYRMTLFEDSIDDTLLGTDTIEKEYHSALAATVQPMGLKVYPQAIAYELSGGTETEYQPKYYKIDTTTETDYTQYDVWVGYETKAGFTSIPTPHFTSIPVKEAIEDEAYQYNITTDNPNPDNTLAISAPTQPGWSTLTDNSDGTARLAGTPDSVDDQAIVLQVEDNTGLTGLQKFTITVTARPQFQTTGLPDATKNQAYSQDVVANDEDPDDTLTIDASSSLPDGLSLTDNGDRTATLEGTPTAGGDHSITLQVEDSDNLTNSATFTLTVRTQPQFQTTALTDGVKDGAYSQTITATDENSGDTLTISETLPLPAGLSLTDNRNRTATLAGTPTSAGSFNVELTVEDDTGLSTTHNFTLTVNARPQFQTASPLTDGVEGELYSQNIVATDEDDNIYTIAALSLLPAWLQLISSTGSDTAMLQGTPTAADSFDIELKVEDSTGLSTTESFALTILEATQPVSEGGEGEPLQGKFLIQRQPADESEWDEEEEEENRAQQKRTLAFSTMIDEAPEPPPDMMERVQGNALAYAEADAEEYDLALQQQQIGAMVEHGQGQMVELEGTRQMTAVNKQGVDAQIQDTETQMAAQDEMKSQMAAKEGDAKKTAQEGGEGQNLLSKIFSGIMSAFGLGSGQGAGDNGAQGGAGEMKDNVKDTANKTEDTAEATVKGQKSVDKNKARTMAVKQDAEKAGSDLDNLDAKLESDMQENQEGLNELEEAGTTNEEDIAEIQDEKSRLADEHMEAVIEAEIWAEQHRFMREAIFSELETDLG